MAVQERQRTAPASTATPAPGPVARRHTASLLHGRERTTGLRWWHEVLLIGVGYAIYTLIRNAVPAHDAPAFANARHIEQVERALGLFHEHGVNNWLAAHRALAIVADYWYAGAHFAVTAVVAVWVLWKHPRHARPLRIAWYTTNLLALIGFAFFPLAPPRLLPGAGFFDTVVRFGTWGSWGKDGIDSASNQYAAMPSMHIGWSTWCAIVVVGLASRWWVKALAVAYPIGTLLVIVGTANHYVLDAVGGLAALAGGFAVQRLLTRAGPFIPEPPPAP